ncbi:hypothetical protein LMG27177_04890 [Paraburkholderia fynbosensis]|uniref:Uncharacterized protein n=1 Tax=Paraburkholderia fynbosensis TaxID=1200993 RepID=A0A6J5GK43_9BURK|nr:hypothetical protein LMG27177_04890 [Paraburkholderia fynbosensis]
MTAFTPIAVELSNPAVAPVPIASVWALVAAAPPPIATDSAPLASAAGDVDTTLTYFAALTRSPAAVLSADSASPILLYVVPLIR